MAENELKMCLFCGCKYSSVISNSTKYHVDCNRCHATGEEKWTEAEAIAAWNRRFVCPDKNGKAVFAGDEVKCVPLYHLRKVLPDKGVVTWCELTFGWTVAVGKRKYALRNFTSIELIGSESGK